MAELSAELHILCERVVWMGHRGDADASRDAGLAVRGRPGCQRGEYVDRAVDEPNHEPWEGPMIIHYDKNTGDLLRFQVGALMNAASYETDGYMVVDPGGKYLLPEDGAGLFHLNELADPNLADDVARAIYDQTGKYYVDVAATPPALMEVVT